MDIEMTFKFSVFLFVPVCYSDK